MKFERSSGILLHPTSLPGKFGIGDLGPAAYAFVDNLKEAGCKLWQVLPLGPTGFGDSPYQSFSAFAGNPLLISLELLQEDGLINIEDSQNLRSFAEDRIDYGELIPWKNNYLEQAYYVYSHSNLSIRKDYESFCDQNAFWLDEFAAFMTLKELQGGGSWIHWAESLKKETKKIIKKMKEENIFIYGKYKFTQFLFFKQWNSIKSYANNLDVTIIGDVPLYVALDSADTWAHQDLFQLDDQCKPRVVAGVPPDYFSSTGQLWGNPIYCWEENKIRCFEWWLERIKSQLRVANILRLDHFRGFAGFWEIPATDLTAENGYWMKGPGMGLFYPFLQELATDNQLPFIAEDLGEITPDVIQLRNELNLPGMKIMQFAFSGPENVFLPHNHINNCVVYTGTHDNDTSVGWFITLPENEKFFVQEYLGTDGVDIAWDLIRSCWSSVAVFAIAPMQDLLNLDSSARMNYPGRLGENWNWRMLNSAFSEEIIRKLKKYNDIFGRI